MASKEKVNNLIKTDWVANFNLIGKAVVNDYTFKIDAKSEKSDWMYNSINLGVDCGEKYGTVYCELMDGYGTERENYPIYVFGKEEDGTADFTNSYQIAFEDRLDQDLVADVADISLITVGLEKTDKDKTFYNKFLKGYDAIAYAYEHLKDGMVVNVKGQLKYTVYNGNIQCRKEINSIVLSQADPEYYHATFSQSILLDRDSCTKESLDKNKSVLLVNAYVLEKFKEFNGHDLTEGGKNRGGQFVPLKKTFEFPVDISTPEGKEKTNKIIQKFFKVKKGVTQINFNGEFIESGATVQTTVDDLSDDIKELIDMGIYTEEEAIALCSDNGTRERRMLIRQPIIRKVGPDDKKVSKPQIFNEKFTEEDLALDCLIPVEEDDVPFDESTDETKEETVVDNLDDDSWLDQI
uniref:hypothetical protein n=1 Tax=Coprococcus catus TaxID=116085 RepID=UPI0022E3CFFB|nr:hypothetical protein [Coprococcus catus]